MKKIILACIFPIALGACKDHKTHQTEVVDSEQTSSKDPTFEKSAKMNFLEVMDEVPKIDGCTCLLAENEVAYKQGKFIYVDDYGSIAQMMVKGKMVEFELNVEEFDPEYFSKDIDNGTYRLTFDTKKIKEDKGIFYYNGTLTLLEISSGLTYETAIYGSAGCP